MKHLCCLRHLLVSLGRKTFSSQIGNLITAPTKEEYDILKREYENSWASINGPTNKSKITRLLKKIGHKYQDGFIQISDMERWGRFQCNLDLNTRCLVVRTKSRAHTGI